jgi:hypothetical protein
MAQTNQRNIKAIYKLATAAERINGSVWYPIARDIAQTLAGEYGVRLNAVIGVIAALSPRNKWSRNVVDAENLITAYIADPESAATVKVCTFGANKVKAIACLKLDAERGDDGVHFSEILAILSGPKLREFASCIAGLDEVCIDGHAYCIWTGGRTSLKDVPAIGVKLRRQIKQDYRVAAADLGLTPSACQAITWCTWRRIHGIG